MERILFNSEKHHLGTISEKIISFKDQPTDGLKSMLDALVINTENDRAYNGVVDVYEGYLTANNIKREVLAFMEQNQVVDFESYKKFIESQGKIKRRGHYLNLEFSDKSIFTLRMIEDPKMFVHIHPGRYSPNTFRVKANTLKTAIVTEFLALSRQQSPYNLDLVNEARRILELSPVDEKISSIYETVEKINNYVARLQNLPAIPRPNSTNPAHWTQWLQKCLQWLGKPKKVSKSSATVATVKAPALLNNDLEEDKSISSDKIADSKEDV